MSKELLFKNEFGSSEVIKLIQITAYEWCDKTNGNTYFTYKISLNKQKFYKDNVMQYGYGSHYLDIAKNKLKELLNIEFNHLSELESEYNLYVINSKYQVLKKQLKEI